MAKDRSRFGDFLINLVAIIIGIFVTFYITDKIADRKEQKDLQLQLNAIKVELESNLENIEDLSRYFCRMKNLSEYLYSTRNPANVSTDSTDVYLNRIVYVTTVSHKKDAYEMLKSTGGMRLINDKQLLLDIMNCYSTLEKIRNDCNYYFDVKQTFLLKVFNNYNYQKAGIDLRQPSQIGLYNFLSDDWDTRYSVEEGERIVAETLQRLEQIASI